MRRRLSWFREPESFRDIRLWVEENEHYLKVQRRYDRNFVNFVTMYAESSNQPIDVKIDKTVDWFKYHPIEDLRV